MKVNDKIVVEKLGLMTITDIDNRTISGSATPLLVASRTDGMRAVLPLNSPSYRDLTSSTTVINLIAFLRGPLAYNEPSSWNRRYRKMAELLSSYSFGDAIFVFKLLQSIKARNDLSFGERKMAKRAYNIISDEAKAVLGDDIEVPTLGLV